MIIKTEMASTGQETFQRLSCDYENLSSRFMLQDRNYQRQYAHLYSERLTLMRPALEEAARRKWGEDAPLCHLYQLVGGEKRIVVGTLFKSMELKPSILKEISEDRNLTPQPSRERFSSDSDFLVLEDELQRVVLTGNIDAQTAITGVVLAVKGFENDDGKFEVEDTCYVDLPSIEEYPPLDDDRYLILMSGLGIGNDQTDLMSLQLMVDIITGQLGTADQQKMFSKVVRVIIAGNSLSESTRDRDVLTTAKYLTRKSQAGTVEAIKTLDHLLVQLTSCIPVDLMAGDFDPANSSLPQQPFHRCMFPQSSVYSTFNSVTNPYEAKIAGMRVLGSSGQNVTDIYQFTTMDDRLSILEQTLKYGHIAPSAPDTLACYPYYNKDPFIIKDCPAIYFAGNQPRFQTKKVVTGSDDEEVLLVTVPSFQETKSCVIVNLRTMDCQPLIFSADLSSS
ncbi:DNA polymerase delta subunit 2-like [Lytechinus variegatus]|uniref:DNA polymerase delta subunit 2-like n=1 Tax=Lytechinus variegatus TaxID=7654 RepID=UPI001BB2AD78|nr:DNA polymerase delta subunit 2-like [Lytechinus variegatus]XP_041473977.1 DNA polymerase delta subunit 2-like [Lytechinus variegatus]